MKIIYCNYNKTRCGANICLLFLFFYNRTLTFCNIWIDIECINTFRFLCWHCLWIVHSWLPLRFPLTFISLICLSFLYVHDICLLVIYMYEVRYFSHKWKTLACLHQFTKMGGLGLYHYFNPSTFCWSACSKLGEWMVMNVC